MQTGLLLAPNSGCKTHGIQTVTQRPRIPSWRHLKSDMMTEAEQAAVSTNKERAKHTYVHTCSREPLSGRIPSSTQRPSSREHANRGASLRGHTRILRWPSDRGCTLKTEEEIVPLLFSNLDVFTRSEETLSKSPTFTEGLTHLQKHITHVARCPHFSAARSLRQTPS